GGGRGGGGRGGSRGGGGGGLGRGGTGRQGGGRSSGGGSRHWRGSHWYRSRHWRRSHWYGTHHHGHGRRLHTQTRGRFYQTRLEGSLELRRRSNRRVPLAHHTGFQSDWPGGLYKSTKRARLTH